MTTKEISQFTGKEERTVQRWIKKAGDKMSSVDEKSSSAGHGKIVDYSIDEVEAILMSGSMSMDAIKILMQNARNNNLPIKNIKVPIQNEKVNTTEIIKDVMKEMLPLFLELIKQNNNLLLTQLNKKESKQLEYIQDYFSIIAFANNNNIKITFSEAQIYGKKSVLISNEKNIEVRQVPNERFGKVKSYRIDVLKEVFDI